MQKQTPSNCDEVGCWVGKLPKGCAQCIKGLKSVFFATGICGERCFYCPLSSHRKGSARNYINESLVRDERDILLEILASSSKGVGVTGGDPLIVADYVAEVIRLLKDNLGRRFHVHLYTTGKHLDEKVMNTLVNVGLDELRIHVTGTHSWEALRIALDHNLDVGIENPAVPDFEGLKNMISEGVKFGVDFINLNEMEVSESNYLGIMSKGLRVNSDGLTVAGSRETALRVMAWVLEEGVPVNIHYCPARFKDMYQFRRRLIRRFRAVRMPYETLSIEGTVKWVEVPYSESESLRRLILSGLAVRRGNTVYASVKATKYWRANLPNNCRVVEAYPTTPRRILNTCEI
ncbi:MAG: radical SAM protein [Zestosphaera sp.]